MPNATSDPELHRKQLDALRRAVPVTRMVDYGVPLGDALEIHERASGSEGPVWDTLCAEIAHRHVEQAGDALRGGHHHTASSAWRWASALFQCAQLAYNADGPRKHGLYERAHDALVSRAKLVPELHDLALQTEAGIVHGWQVQPAGSDPRAAVVVLGGLSGWGSAYLDMGEALARRGILAILAEGPGQGLTRMRSGIYLSAGTLPLMRAFVTHARDLGVQRVGVWGNSFGGLLATRLAIADPRIDAVCVNGAPFAPQAPEFRTAREQIHAACGVASEEALAPCLEALALSLEHDRLEAHVLVVEGGRDLLAPLGSQGDFLRLAVPGRAYTMSWIDGEHTIYNRAIERNARVADWFVDRLGGHNNISRASP